MHRSRILGSHCFLVATALAYLHCATAFGAGPSGVDVQKVLTGLKNPVSVAIRPEGAAEQHEVFTAESAAGRIVKVLSSSAEKKIDVIAGFATHSQLPDDSQSLGVQSLHFLDHTRLVVAGHDEDDRPFVRLYEMPENATPLTADHHKQEVEFSDNATILLGPFTFGGIARTQPNDRVGDMLIMTAQAGREPAGLLQIPVRAGTLGTAARIRVAGADKNSNIRGIAVGTSGHLVIASSSLSEADEANKLKFVNPVSRRVVMQVPTELQRIVALAYSPKSGNLYAANSPATDDGRAGIYRIDGSDLPGDRACTVVRIADVPRPTALAFADDGTMYVTSLGERKSERPGEGVVLKLTGNL
jgi:hypothetical protein